MYRIVKKVLARVLGRSPKISMVPPGNDAILPCWIISLDSLPEGQEKNGWNIHRIFKGPTAVMKQIGSHVSVLSSGGIPHPPHAHEEEELLIMLSGEADIITVDATDRTVDTARVVSGSIVYHCAHQKHTIQVTGSVPAVYLIFKWTGNSGGNREAALKSSIFQGTGVSDKPVSLSAGQSVRTVIFESPTQYLRKLRCHISTLQPGAGYPPHIDAYDVAILTLRGTVETLGRLVGPSSIIFYAAGEPHGMKNAGTVPARYIVIEFHGSSFRRKQHSPAR